LNIEKPSKELSATEIISLSFNLYRSKFLQFFLPFLIQGIIIGTFSFVLTSTFPMPETPTLPNSPNTSFYYEEMFPWLFSFISTVIVIGVLSGLVSWIVGTTTTGIAVKYASDQIETGTSNLRTSFNFALSKLPSLLPSQFVAGILIVIGMLFFVVPGIILAIMFSLIVPTIIIEKRGAFESLGRSKKLVSNRWQETFVLGLILAIISFVVMGATLVISMPFNTSNLIVNPFITNITIAFVGPIYPIAIIFLYYSLVARENQSSIG